MKKILLGLLLGCFSPYYTYADIVFRKNENISVSINAYESVVVHTAFDIFVRDYKKVFDADVVQGAGAQVFIGTLGNSSEAEKNISKKLLEDLRAHREGYVMEVHSDKLYILGSDKRGTAYGILELSRLIGVSPWEWWADAPIEKKTTFSLKDGYSRLEYPSVKYRGIFINDEDWGLMPWSSKTFEPGLPTVGKTKGAIGPGTYSKVFELLLRLRANTLWPAMHEVSVPFYFTKGNKEAADKYGIIIGTSHCEPLMRNSATEWDVAGKGDYNYVINREGILNYWTERLKALNGSDNIYTIGLRGKHDGMMQGVKTLAEHKAVLSQVITDQRTLLNTYTASPLRGAGGAQVFIPYKEVLDVYNDGLEVPEDVTLVWCDDNYGYLKHFPDQKERARKGGNGVYYHASYWGRPHDYLWLATNHPAQLYTQMKQAYDKGARDLWILNVGDIKPAEYLTELFLDMAWNIGSIENNIHGLDQHLQSWLSREFGTANAKALLPVMNEYYRLAYIRKPEFMGGTRTEESDPRYKIVTDLSWSEAEIHQRIKDYDRIVDKVIQISKTIPAAKQDAWFQLIEYPVRGAAEMNKKHLYGQLARHGKASWDLSDEAYETIVSLTRKYNSLGNGKWKGIMDHQPRDLAVFEKLPRIVAGNAMRENIPSLYVFNGSEYKRFAGSEPVAHGLGYRRSAVSVAKGSAVVYRFKTKKTGAVDIELALAPNHPVEGKAIRYSIQVDGDPEQVIDYATHGRSEEWKENVLSNQARRTTRHDLAKKGTHTITIKALDEGVIIDQGKIWPRR